MKICGTVRKPVRALDHLGALVAIEGDVDLLELEALAGRSRFAARQ